MAFAFTQAAWRFFQNESVTPEVLAEPGGGCCGRRPTTKSPRCIDRPRLIDAGLGVCRNFSPRGEGEYLQELEKLLNLDSIMDMENPRVQPYAVHPAVRQRDCYWSLAHLVPYLSKLNLKSLPVERRRVRFFRRLPVQK